MASTFLPPMLGCDFPTSVITSCKVSDLGELTLIFCHFSLTSCFINVSSTDLSATPSKKSSFSLSFLLPQFWLSNLPIHCFKIFTVFTIKDIEEHGGSVGSVLDSGSQGCEFETHIQASYE